MKSLLLILSLLSTHILYAAPQGYCLGRSEHGTTIKIQNGIVYVGNKPLKSGIPITDAEGTWYKMTANSEIFYLQTPTVSGTTVVLEYTPGPTVTGAWRCN